MKLSLKQKIFEYGVEPKRRRGQNFLIDENILKKIVSVAGITKKDTVVEIGAGLGFLTNLLSQVAKKVFAIELDKELFEILKKEVSDKKNIICIQDDAREVPLSTFGKKNGSYRVVANIPYNITSQIIQKFLEGTPHPSDMILLIQKEVAERICAQPPDMSILACAVQYFAKPKILFDVSRFCFYPQPNVDSTVLRITVQGIELTGSRVKPGMTKADSAHFFRCIHAGFAQKRKFLISNLQKGLHISRKELERVFGHLGIPLTIRAQELSVDQWKELIYTLVTYL